MGQLSRAITSLADGRLETRPAGMSLPPHAGHEQRTVEMLVGLCQQSRTGRQAPFLTVSALTL